MTADAPFRIEPLGSHHDRSAFSCGAEPLDTYIRSLAMQDVRRRFAACFVITKASSRSVIGYYTISATSVLLTELPSEVSRKLPRYPTVPATLLGRLAIATERQGQRLGEALLVDAIHRVAGADIASFAIIVDAKNDTATAFYAGYGFTSLGSSMRRMFLPLGTATARLARR